MVQKPNPAKLVCVVGSQTTPCSHSYCCLNPTTTTPCPTTTPCTTTTPCPTTAPHTCAKFTCPVDYMQVKDSGKVVCDTLTGCSVEDCCLIITTTPPPQTTTAPHTCEKFTCPVDYMQVKDSGKVVC